MLKLMQAKELVSKQKQKKSRKSKIKEKPWFLYILECCDGSFYTGITNNIERRFQMHVSGRASKYTRTRRPVELLYHESCTSRVSAMVREAQVKAFTRIKKEELIHKKQSTIIN